MKGMWQKHLQVSILGYGEKCDNHKGMDEHEWKKKVIKTNKMIYIVKNCYKISITAILFLLRLVAIVSPSLTEAKL